MKYGIYDSVNKVWIKNNYKEYLLSTGIPVTDLTVEALSEDIAYVEHEFERIKYYFSDKPLVLSDLEVRKLNENGSEPETK